MGHHGHPHSHLVPAEKIILGFIIWVPIVYFVVVLFLKIFHAGLFSIESITSLGSVFFPGFWREIVETWTVWLAPVFIVADIFMLAVLIFATVMVWPIRGRISRKDPPTHGAGLGHADGGAKPKKNPAVLKYWTAIINKANTGVPENLRSAVLEADALVDFYLKQAGYAGEHMADRLSQISRSGVKSLDRVWDTHRLRNEIAHTPGFVVTSKQAEKALLAVRDFLKEMGAF
jgi:hypothetical protein